MQSLYDNITVLPSIKFFPSSTYYWQKLEFKVDCPSPVKKKEENKQK